MLKLRDNRVNGTVSIWYSSFSCPLEQVEAPSAPNAAKQEDDVKNLIVNADDLGWTEGVNRGIVEAHRNGIVTSASLLANGDAFESAVKLALATPAMGVGAHLNLSDGKPVSPVESVSSIVNEDGEFAGGPESMLLKVARRNLRMKEIESEWDNQVRKIKAAGIQPTHLDGHKHIHMLPGMFEIAVRVAKRHGIGAVRVAHEGSTLRSALATGEPQNTLVVTKQGVQARVLKLLARDARAIAEKSGVSTTDYFCGIAQTGELTIEGLQRFLENLPEGTTELMCHPGYSDEALENSPTRLQESRESELNILTNVEIRNLVASQGIRLINYGFVSQTA